MVQSLGTKRHSADPWIPLRDERNMIESFFVEVSRFSIKAPPSKEYLRRLHVIERVLLPI